MGHPASGGPQGGAEGPFLFLVFTPLLAFYIRRTCPDVAPYPLRTTLLPFADDMAVVIATALQRLSTTPDPTRATNVLHAVTNYLVGNQLLVHNVRSATMVHNAPPQPLRPEDPPMNPVSIATYLGVQQAATANELTIPPNLIRQLTRTLVIAHIVALSTQALAYFRTSRAQRRYRVPGPTPNAPPTHATSGPNHGTASVDHPRPSTQITTRGGTRGVATILRRQHGSPRQQRVHSSDRGPPAPSHAQA